MIQEYNYKQERGLVSELSVTDAILKRRSSRAYAEQLVEEEKIKALFEAARWAPSAMNEQPWLFVYADSYESPLHSVISESLTPSNKVWAAKAPLLIVSAVRQTFKLNGKHNPAALHDAGMANLALTLTATSLGLNAHMMGGFDATYLEQQLHLPGTVKPVVVMAVGYPGDSAQLPEALQKREIAPRIRKEHGEFIFNHPLFS